MISRDRIAHLHDRYLELVRLEVEEFGVKPTEVRHLIGRLGEFYCALHVGGTLSHRSNQHGFDVVCSQGRRVSVKTTAQTSGFIGIGISTVGQVDDLMLLQYQEGFIATIFYGPMADVIPLCRSYSYSKNYELDIAKARKLMVARTANA